MLKHLTTTAAAFLFLAVPAFAAPSPAPHAMGGHMQSAMHGHMKGDSMHGHMKGGSMHGHMKGDSMHGHMKGDAMHTGAMTHTPHG